MADGLTCTRCGRRYPLAPMFRGCPACRERGVVAPLVAHYPPDAPRRAWEAGRSAGARMWAFRALLPLPPGEEPVSLGEGGTLLLRVALPGLPTDPHLKLEHRNPTGSFKDRLNSVAVSMARYHGFRAIVCSSTGNHGASLAAYAAAAGVRCVVLLPEGAPPLAVEEIRALGGLPAVTPWDARGRWVAALVERGGCAVSGRNFPRTVGSPYGLEGYKTIAYEIVRDLGGVPGTVFMPVGGGDGLYGLWRGFVDLRRGGLIASLPRLIGCQSEAAPSVYRAYADGNEHVESVDLRPSIAVSLTDRQGGDHALWAVRESAGVVVALSEGEIAEAVDLLGGVGLDVEPAAAAPVAGLRRVGRDAAPPVVCVLTGRGERWRIPAAPAAQEHQPRTPEEALEMLGLAEAGR